MRPLEAYFGSDIVCVLGNEEQVRQVVPDQELIRQMDGVCFHITAHGNEGDGLEIAPCEAHQMCSQSDDAVEFLGLHAESPRGQNAGQNQCDTIK